MTGVFLLGVSLCILSLSVLIVCTFDAFRKFKCDHNWSEKMEVYVRSIERPVETRLTCTKCGKRIKL